MIHLLATGSIALPASAAGYAASCSGAQSSLLAKRTALQGAIDEYRSCVARSTGQDDCAEAFRKVRALQADFATAVADLHGNCPPE